MRQKKTWGVLTAALAAVAVGTCALSGAALETGSGELGGLQAFCWAGRRVVRRI